MKKTMPFGFCTKIQLFAASLIATALLASPMAHAAQSAQPVKDWNFLVYLNGVNSLDEFGPINLKQMEAVGSSAHINILVQWGSMSKPSVDRLLVQKSTDANNVTSPILQSLGQVDMGDPQTLVDFAKWAHDNYPAKKTFLVVWNHGGGWHLKGLSNNLVPNVDLKPTDISWDDRTGHHISTEQLGVAMSKIAAINGHKVDIYASDACLMAMAEVAREMSDSVEVFAGSQDVEPGAGWPYTDFLAHWTAQPNMTALEVAKTLSHDYTASYSGGSNGQQSVTFSVFDLKHEAELDSAVQALAKELTALPAAQLAKIKDASAQTKSFTYADYKDILDLLDHAGTGSLAPRSTAAVRTAVSQYVVANDQNQDAMTHGLSIWMPTDASDVSTYLERYRGLKFNKATGWADVVAKAFGQ